MAPKQPQQVTAGKLTCEIFFLRNFYLFYFPASVTEENNVFPKALFLHLGTRRYAPKRVKRALGTSLLGKAF